MSQHSPLRKLPDLIGGWLILPLLLGLTSSLACAQTTAHAQQPVQRNSNFPPAFAAAPVAAPELVPAPALAPPLAVSSGPVVTLNLAECLQTALHRQPRIAAARDDVASAEAGKVAVDNLRLAALVDREIPLRRRQAALGVSVAAAGVDQAERETVYSVTRTYFSVLYAREQERITRKVVERLSATHDAAQQQLNNGARDITTADVNRALVYLRQAQAKQVQAAQGAKRALAALKEAIGLELDARLEVPDARLPDPDLHPAREEIVALTLARHANLIQASLFAEITCLEVAAQGTSLLKRVDTFAAGADIHSSQVPQGYHNGDYRPGAVPPAMPTLLVGSRADRVHHAETLYARAAAVVEVTRNLVALDAENAFLHWEEASQQVPPAREAADAGDKLADALSRDYAANLKVRTEEVVTAHVLAAQARAQYNEYLFNKILALADLERVTGGGFCAGLVEATFAQARPAPQGSGNK